MDEDAAHRPMPWDEGLAQPPTGWNLTNRIHMNGELYHVLIFSRMTLWSNGYKGSYEAVMYTIGFILKKKTRKGGMKTLGISVTSKAVMSSGIAAVKEQIQSL
uniref:Voltage-dependent L-type calcium channel subunit beta-2 n=1 Tax=Angiostrongylus cantonensis TaxID=6313 RepID=A0A0K0D6X2_ANGCA